VGFLGDLCDSEVTDLWFALTSVPSSQGSAIFSPWVMGRATLYNGIGTPWVMGCTTLLNPHGSWIVQHYRFSMGHGLYKGIDSPWVMGCTRAWVVQEHGLYKSMGCTRAWVVQEHGLYRGVCSPWGMAHMPIPGRVIFHESPNKDIFDGFPR
jgi:hypothetical protein